MAREYSLEKTRNLGIMAHIDAGKLLVVSVFYFIPKIHKIGETMMVNRKWIDGPRTRAWDNYYFSSYNGVWKGHD